MRKITIIGMAGAYDGKPEPGEEMWGVNRTYKHQKNLSRLYFLDHINAFDPEFVSEVNALNIPVFCQTPHADIKWSFEYPRDEIEAMFPMGYFTSTVAWMIAHAIYEKVDHIHLHKILALPVNGDYYDQKPCLEMWVGIAMGSGIRFSTTDSAVGQPMDWQTGAYGYEPVLPFGKMLYQMGMRKVV